MQRKKILIACLSVLLVGLAVPNIPRAHAFLAVPPTSLTFTGLGVTSFTDPLTGNTLDGIAAGATLTINVYIVASSGSPLQEYQRNITVGYKGDWMTSYQNATNANQGATYSMTSGQVATITLAVVMPTSGGIASHSWSVAVWDGASNSRNAASCAFGGTNRDKQGSPLAVPADCFIVPNPGYNALAIYTSDQLSAAQANVQSTQVVADVTSAISILQFHPNTPGITAASGQLAQAKSEQALGVQSWRNGDYAGAKTHWQNALNNANTAAGSLTNQGGGVDNATVVNLILGSTGIALIGIGALFAGLGAFFYWRRKPKA